MFKNVFIATLNFDEIYIHIYTLNMIHWIEMPWKCVALAEGGAVLGALNYESRLGMFCKKY